MSRFRMLVSAPADRATGPGDFSHTDDGELLYEGQVVRCSSVMCGCSVRDSTQDGRRCRQ